METLTDHMPTWSRLQKPVLVLNASYEPINICAARRALVLVLKGIASAEEDSAAAVHSNDLHPRVLRVVLFELEDHGCNSGSLNRKTTGIVSLKPMTNYQRKVAKARRRKGKTNSSLRASACDLQFSSSIALRGSAGASPSRNVVRASHCWTSQQWHARETKNPRLAPCG